MESGLGPEKIADLRLSYLEMLQAAISRMASNSATLKNYCVTLVAATCGLAITIEAPAVILLGWLPVLVFAYLDSKYLQLERCFRSLYDGARQEDWTSMPSFNLDLSHVQPVSLRRVLRSWSISHFYLPLAVGVGVASGLMAVLHVPANH
jgi:hypothetical protein